MKKAIEELQLNEKIKFTFQNEEFVIFRYGNYDRYDKVTGCSISREGTLFNSMNIEKVTSKYITVYEFNMMGQKSTFKFPINEIKSLTKTQ